MSRGENICTLELLFGSISFYATLILGQHFPRLKFCIVYDMNAINNKKGVKDPYPIGIESL